MMRLIDTIVSYQLQFDSLSSLLAMDKHGFYVWLAYGLTALVVVWNLVQPVVMRKRLLKEQAKRLRAESRDAPKA